MATSGSEGKPAFIKYNSRIPAGHVEEEEEECNNVHDHEYQDPVSADGCGCFRLFRFNSCWGHDYNEDGHPLQERERGDRANTWWAKKLKKAKEFSEVVAGPKWKNFIRKCGGYFNNNKNKKKNRFQYDAESYALNFDGGGDFDSEENGLLPSFSSRFPLHFPQQQPRPPGS